MKLKTTSTILCSAMLCSLVALSGCQSETAPSVDLDRVLDVASNSMTIFEETAKNVTEENAMDEFATVFTKELNAANPAIHTGQIGVAPKEDGSLSGYDDENNNQIEDSGETNLFNVEVDTENGRLIASAESEVREHGFSMGGLLMGMLIGNLLGRQLSSGANPAQKQATPKAAKSRAGSGSHSKGK